MRVSDETVEKLLKQGGIVNDSQLDELKTLAKRSKQSLQETVIDQKVVSDEKLTKMIGELIDVPFVRIEPKDILDDVLKKIPEHIARQYNVVLFAIACRWRWKILTMCRRLTLFKRKLATTLRFSWQQKAIFWIAWRITAAT